MAVAACEHTKAFPHRVMATMTVKVTNIIWNLHGDLRCVQKAAEAARGHVLDAPNEASEAALRAKLLKAGVTPREADDIVLMSREERCLLGDLAASTDYMKRWSYVFKCNKLCWQLVVHLKRYSAYMSEFMQNEFMLPPEQGGGDGGIEEEEVEEDEASATEEHLPSEQRKWTRYRKPRPFTVLPVFKTRGPQVDYGPNCRRNYAIPVHYFLSHSVSHFSRNLSRPSNFYNQILHPFFVSSLLRKALFVNDIDRHDIDCPDCNCTAFE